MTKIHVCEQLGTIKRSMRNGRPAHLLGVLCKDCGDGYDHDITARPPAETVVKDIAAVGWVHLNDGKKWRCPACEKLRRGPQGRAQGPTIGAAVVGSKALLTFALAASKATTKEVAVTAQPGDVAAALAKVPKAQQLVILDTLRGSFDEKAGQYVEGSDQVVADKHGVGFAVVAAIREEWLGPIREDPLIGELRRMILGCHNTMSDLQGQVTEAKKAIVRMDAKLAELTGKRSVA